MNIYAKQVNPAEQEHTFKFENFPQVFAWQPKAPSKSFISFEYEEAMRIGDAVYCYYVAALKMHKSVEQATLDTTKYIHENHAKLNNLLLKPLGLADWMDSLQALNQGMVQLPAYRCIVLSAYLGYKVHWVSYKKLNSGMRVVLAEGSDSVEQLDYLWSELYDAGTEWVLHATDEVPSTADEVEGFVVYCHSQNIEQVAVELSEYAGYTGTDTLHVTLYSFQGQPGAPAYRKVTITLEDNQD